MIYCLLAGMSTLTVVWLAPQLLQAEMPYDPMLTTGFISRGTKNQHAEETFGSSCLLYNNQNTESKLNSTGRLMTEEHAL